ncbi:MAG: glycoside hydrolase family 65 protein [Sandaracinaceae bacterium]
MRPQRQTRPPEYVYPSDRWRLVEKRFYPRLLPQTETFFSLANGYFGMRGGFEEGEPAHEHGTFVNAFHETWPILYGEDAFGFAKTGQTIVNLPDPKGLRLYVDDERLYLPKANLLRFERVLDMREGTLARDLVWQTPAGKRVRVRSRRLVSFEHRHVAAIEYEVTLLDTRAPVLVSSEILLRAPSGEAGSDPRRRALGSRVLDPATHEADELRVVLSYATKQSGMTLGCGLDHTVETACEWEAEAEANEDAGRVLFSLTGLPEEPIRIVKYISYHTSTRTPPEELVERTHRTLSRVRPRGFEELVTSQRAYLDDFWEKSDVEVDGVTPPASRITAASVQQAIRFSLFQLLQATARTDDLGVPAKGLTGQGYEGHYFWDTEMYVLPFLAYTRPAVAKAILARRYHDLDAARERARQVNQKGALFPWRTINGEEASAYYAASTAQYHINADIAYALRTYVWATGDEEFLVDVGAEILVETARLWVDLGFFSDKKGGRFCITGVTGPDEYNTVVNNNLFTNLMARENLWYAAAAVERIRTAYPDRLDELVDRTSLDLAEVEAWREAADRMYVPYDPEQDLYLQDDDFLDRQPWDFENTPPESYPLLLHYHPLVIYRHQVIKQADVVLAMFLLADEFSPEQKRRVFDFYDPLTTRDSSLSACIQSIVAAEIGDQDKAIRYAREALFLDLEDRHHNTKDGLHIASMGGAWMALVYGFAGFRNVDGRIRFRPQLPPEVGHLRFPLTIRGCRVRIDMRPDRASFTLEEGEDTLVFDCSGHTVLLSTEQPRASVALNGQMEVAAG